MNSSLISDDPAPDIQTLRHSLLKYAQSLSGNVWTDYNIHDPGVMLLEQIAYAITETEYRAALPIIDRLKSATATHESEPYQLTPPDQVMRMQAVTVDDLEAVLSSAHSSVERVMICPRKGKESGLYDIHVIPITQQESDQACKAVACKYTLIRNLCEDAKVVAAIPVRCTLALSLEHHRRALPEKIVAEAFARCSDLLIGRPLPGAQISADEAFDDPVRLTPGWTAFEDRARNTSLLSNAVAQIPDVLQVSGLKLIDCESSREIPISSIADGKYFDLAVPEDLTSITLTSRGRQSMLNREKISCYLPHFEHNHKPYQSPAFPILENATLIDIKRLAVAEELPVAYLTGKQVDPDTLPEHRRSKARQFRSYLKLIDTLLDDMESSRSGMPSLYSDIIGNLETDSALISRSDSHLTMLAIGLTPNPEIDQKSRALDRMLGTFGEQFTQSSLKRFRNVADEDADVQVLNNKKRLLRALPEVEQTRGAYSGFCRKLDILLGLPHNLSESKPLNYVLIEDILLRVGSEFRMMEIDIVFPLNTDLNRDSQYQIFVEETVSLVCPAHILPRIYWTASSDFSALCELVENWRKSGQVADAIKIRNSIEKMRECQETVIQ